MATACSGSSNDDGPTRTQQSNEMAAVGLGVTIQAKNDAGVPRLVKAVIPRQPARAGMAVEDIVRDHLAALKPLYMTRQAASDMSLVATQKLRNGASIVRLQQKVGGVDIHQGELRVAVHPDGSLAAVSGTMLPTAGRATFRSTPKAALDRALDEMYGKTRSRPAITVGAVKGGFTEMTVAADAKVSVKSARAKQELLADANGKLTPIWTVEVNGYKPGIDGNDAVAHRVLVGDATGQVMKNVNLIQQDAFVYRAFADTTGDRRPFDGAMKSFNPHPTGTPDGSLPAFAKANLVTVDSFNKNADPWLPANATTTSGNNVDAFADIVAPEGFGDGDIRPEVRSGRVLNYTYDLTKGPLETPDQSKAAVVNAFFIANWMHDWWYDSGFTEATGNAQVSNYGRGGVEGDPIIIHSQDDASGQRDNASMFTPADGSSPEMRMFIFNGGATLKVTAVSGTPASAKFRTGPTGFNLTGTAALTTNLAADGTTVLNNACTAVTSTLTGKIGVFVFDNTCGSATAVNNLKAAGAIGALAIFDVPGFPLQDLNGSAAANIPGLIIGAEDGAALKATLPSSVTLSRSQHIDTDGDLDNAVVAHEWGHYLHHRLASCESLQCAGMSEGWGDFNALMMMLRTSDDRNGTFGAGLYALSSKGFEGFGFIDPGYFGIRRFPYSINRAKNNLSFRHIADENALPAETPANPGPAGGANSEVHNAGEVWASMMWEAYNVLIDQHGRLESRRRMSDYVVAGLLLTPPDATVTEARDAILAAAGALDTDDMLLMAAAFAGRGAGTCAVSPDRFTNTGGVTESGTLAAKIESSTATLTDDGASCDHDGFLDPGESGTLHITIANSGVLAAENVRVKAKTTSRGVALGKTIKVGTLAPFSSMDLSIPVTLAADAPVDSNLDLTVTVTGEAGCDSKSIAVEVHQRMGVDEAADVATVDHVETKITPWQASDAVAWGQAEDATRNHSWFGVDSGFTNDTSLLSPVLQASATENFVMSINHKFDLEAFPPAFFFDGGVIEISTDGGATFADVSTFGVDPHYSGTIPTDFENPLGGRQAFSGTNASFPAREGLTLDFGNQFAGKAVQVRFRIGSDFCCNATGWDIDDISFTGITNTPFPGIVPEPDVCSAPTGLVGDSGASDPKSGPHKSLNGVGGLNTQNDDPDQ